MMQKEVEETKCAERLITMINESARKQIDDMIEDIEKIIYADNKTALEKAQYAYKLSKEADYPQGEAILQLKMGFIYSNISEYTKGIDYIMASIPMLEAYNLNYHICSAFIMLGNVFLELANYETAFDYYNKSVYIARKHQLSGRLSIAYNNIGEIYKNLSNYEKAIYYYEKGLSVDQLMACKGIAHLNLAEINYSRANYDEALRLLPIALELLTKYNYEIHFCEIYKIYALVYWKLKDYEKAERYFLEALNIANEKSVYFNKINILIQYHQFLEEHKQNERAVTVLTDAYSLSTANNINEKSLEICFHFTKMYEKVNDKDSALKYYKLYMYHNQEQLKERNKQIKEGISLRIRTDEIKLQSEIDALTGIPNRRKFLQYYSKQWSNSKLQGYSLALIMMDIDFFKEYNDNYGHIEGDKYLNRIATLLTERLGNQNFLSRYGGDEFIAVLPNTDLRSAVEVAESLRQAVMAEKIEHKHSEISEYVTMTCGVAAIVPNDEKDADSLVKQADDALYEAKKNGRNRVMSYCE